MKTQIKFTCSAIGCKKENTKELLLGSTLPKTIVQKCDYCKVKNTIIISEKC